MTSVSEAPKEQKESHGGRNLVILGVSAIVISLITSSLSLFIYHATGDIYLDRSRPGYLPEKTETETTAEKEETYKFPSEGLVNEKALDEYLKEFDKATEAFDSVHDAFDGSSLTDEFLNIPE